MKKNILKNIIQISVLAGFLIVLQVFAFSEPGQAPPESNVGAPINVGGTYQEKSGDLWLLSTLGIGVLPDLTMIAGENRVGINTIPTGANVLTVNGGYAPHVMRIENNGSALPIYKQVVIEMGVVGSSQYWEFGPHALESGEPGRFVFHTDSLFDNLTLESGGEVGIGTEFPVSKLHISTGGADDSAVRFTHDTITGNTAGDGFVIGISAADTNTYLWNFENLPVIFGTNNLERFRITESGNVGIGTTNPTAKLDVSGTVKLGTAGTAFSAAGTCSVATFVLNTTAVAKTCTGVPASTAVAVYCSPSAALSPASAIMARANGTVNQITMQATAANTVTAVYTCMWVRP